jgi:hypothetical protein
MPKYSRYSRKHKRGGRPPNRSTDYAEGNEQRVEYSERENSDRENNMVETPAKEAKLEIGEVDPQSVGLNKEQRNEYHRQLEEGNRLAYRKKFGRQGPFTRIPDDDDEARGGRKRKTSKKRRTSKRRKTTKKRKNSKKR